ncbi:protein ROLLING AND ERECT LEAF 2 [Ricinus communis]|uniref:protein ROLLING AND ERECT LEAF 2 n=1 Tax=Ricinus communis TaxID=3988 RepID=UPI00201AFBD2|nr:protein ROLLING AND ERECT LEAF 2 [Ricinus communis]
MGCTQSKIENEEAVSRCKERKQFMKEAVSARNAFAAAHSAYSISLKNTGAALSDYTQGEIAHRPSSPSSAAAAASVAAATSSSVAPLPPPPPPLPTFQTTPPLQRAASMPEMKIQKPPEAKSVGPTILEEEELEFEAQDNEKLTRKRSSSNRGATGVVPQPPQPQPQQHQWKEEVMRAPMNQGSYWGDYIFAPAESMPGPSLAEPPAMVEEEEMVEKVSKVAHMEVEPTPSLVVEEKVEKEKAVEVPVHVPMQGVEKKVARKVGGGGEVGRRPGKPVNLIQIFADLDDHFLKASESAHEVSKMLEATRLHYHSNFADNRGHIDHSKRVMRVITWNRSFKGLPDVGDGKDNFEEEEHLTHATVLDKMLAWEKKLYDEVKAGEIMKFEYQKKVALLNRQKKRGSNSESLEKLKAAVSHLHTRYIVDMQSMDSTVAEINHLRDEQLYPKLVQLVDGMATMWETMQYHHDNQSKIVYALRSLDISQSLKETSEYHYDRTCQLCGVVRDWHAQFCRLIDYQKDYIKALNNWIKLNLIPIESNLKEKVSSPPRIQNPPIHVLLIAWHDHLDKLPDEIARSAISNFAAVVQTIVHHQEEEVKMREKCEATRKELSRRIRQLDDWKNKHNVRDDELDPEAEEENPHRNAMMERQGVVDLLKKQLEEEEEACQKLSLQVREKSLASLKTRLPELFRAMSDIALACADMYSNLRSIAHHNSSRD